MGYYWPPIFQDDKRYVQGCDSCQQMGQPTHSDEMPLQAQLVIQPFEKRALDFVGPFNPPSQQKVCILVCTDYITKWVEAKALHRATEQAVVDFLFEEVFCHFGVPREIVTDGGPQFTSHMIADLTKKYGTKH